MKLRHASPHDAPHIAALHTASWRTTYQGLLQADYLATVAPAERQALWAQRLGSPQPNQFVIVADDGGPLLGFACAYTGEHTQWGTYLDNLHVAPGHQSRGIGRALLRAVAQQAHESAPGAGLYLSVAQGNPRAQQFYLALGARNAQASHWQAPEGSAVPAYWFVWDHLAPLRA